jgi:diguanylate cyclase (GGDEF)-like protein/PAS domain S-box-containing protein
MTKESEEAERKAALRKRLEQRVARAEMLDNETEESNESERKEALRLRAEQHVAKAEVPRSDAKKDRLLNELQVHQIELEMQNHELRESQAAQAEALNRYTELFEFAPVAYFVLSQQGEIMSVNLTGATLFETERGKLVGRRLSDYVLSTHRNTLIHFTTAVFALEKKVSFDLELTIGPRIVWVNVELKLDTLGKQGLAAMTDITLHKRAELELKLVSAVYGSLTEAVMVVDKDDKITIVNPAFTTLTGYSDAEAVGQSSSLLRSSQQTAKFDQQMRRQLLETGKWEGEIATGRKHSDDYFGWLSITTIYGDDGEVSHRVSTFFDISEKKQAADIVLKQANFDLLTGLPNRRLFQDRIEQGLHKTARSDTKLALLSLDIDNFKAVNDSLGHQLGDKLLAEAAVRMSHCVRETDTLARLGGDEFVVIMSELDEPTRNIQHVSDRILEVMSEPFELGNSTAYVSASIGVTIFPDDATDIEGLMRNADSAMYVAKREGRNRLHYFTAQMQEDINRKLYLADELRSALSRDELSVAYQPIINLDTGSIHKAGAELQWQHATLGAISPAEFMPIAEENDLVVNIGDWLFFQVAQTIKDWRNHYRVDIQASIKKCSAQFKHHHNQQTWFSYLEEIGLEGEAIVVEITEGLLLDADLQVRKQLTELKGIGIRISLDDFGTQYSPLLFLKQFNVDYLKIDQDFVKDLSQDSDNIAICEAIIVMAHKLGIKVIAEGIETQQQCDLLSNMACDYGQGSLFSKAVSADEFDSFICQTPSS